MFQTQACRPYVAAATLALVAALAPAGDARAHDTGGAGPSSSQPPYYVRTAHGVVPTSVLTVGDTAGNGYRMVGKPDGLGAFDNHDGTFTLLMNHELLPDVGVVRDHGFAGAFVSRWTIDKHSLEVREGDDLAKQVWIPVAGGGWEPLTTALNRLCSADLPDQSAFHDVETGAGTTNRIFMNGEEGGLGRALGHVVDGPDAGSSYVLASLGRAGWENQVAMPNAGARTVVVGTDDNQGGQVYVYVGDKQTTGNDVERAGLVGGTLYGVKIEGVTDESDATTVPEGGAAFSLVPIPGAATLNQNQLNNRSNALGITRMARPEDAAWDVADRRRHRGDHGGHGVRAPDAVYVATTGTFTGTSRLWRLEFSDPTDVTLGGTAHIALASPPYDEVDPQGPRSMDNLTVNRRGQVLIQEDTGNNPYRSGVFQFEPRTGKVKRILQADPALFTLGLPGHLTEAEESSGIIPAPFLGSGEYLLTVQPHLPTGDPETFEYGQLLMLHVPPGKPVH
jgi:hypothetical protein